MNLPPDTVLNNRYRLDRMLGQGGMGAVFLAFDTALDAAVAVKVNQNPAPQSSTQFLREAHLLATLRHPNLPRVTDYFILNEAQYLVMDYIAGKDLNTLLQEEGAQPVERVLEWARQLGNALSYLHHQEPPVIHRDVKPANVRLNAEGEILLVDFGIAKVFDPNQQTTMTGAVGYSPGYAPPEQYGGAVRTGPYSDQYSLAALLYHLLTNQKPADSIQRVLGSARLATLRQLNPAVPEHIQAAIDRALSLRPEDRFADIQDFLRELTSPRAPGEPTVLARADASTAPTVMARPAQVERTVQSGKGVPPVEQVPQRRGANGLLIGGIGLAAIVLLGIAALLAARLLPDMFNPPATQVAGVALIKPSVTASPARAGATPLADAVPSPTAPVDTATPTAEPANTAAPTATAMPDPSTQPSETPTVPATATAAPSTTLPLVGGGGLVAFASDRADGQTFQLWTMRVALNDQGQMVVSELRQLTNSPGDKRQPAWSPDGKRLLYVAPGGPDQKRDIWMMNADGSGEPKDLTNMKGNESEPAWSPDGRWIAFTSDIQYGEILQLYLIRPDGSQTYKLSYDQMEYGPAWMPDNQISFIMDTGMQIVFIRGHADPKTGAAPTREYYVTPYRFDTRAFTDNLGQAAEPAWSPDGKWMVYTRQLGQSSNIALAHYPLRVPAQDVIKLTDTGKDSHPGWSPDGQWIVFHSKRDGNDEIYIMRTTGKSQTNLTNAPGRDVDPVWQR